MTEKPLTIDSIAYECDLDCVLLGQRLAFLVKNGLIQEGTCKNKTVYALTKRGSAISETLAITRRLEKMQTSTNKLDSLQMLPAFFEDSNSKVKRTR